LTDALASSKFWAFSKKNYKKTTGNNSFNPKNEQSNSIEKKQVHFLQYIVHFVNIANYAKQPFLVSSRNAPCLWGGALRDDTKLNGCVADQPWNLTLTKTYLLTSKSQLLVQPIHFPTIILNVTNNKNEL